MRILISGGAGFIASHIQDAYLELGHEVAIVDDLSSGEKGNLHPKSHFYLCNITDPKLEDIFKEFKPDVISHHAAQISVRESIRKPQFDCQINGIGTLNILEQAIKFSVKKIIFSSSGGAIYGEQQSFPANENHPLEPLSPYGITKLLGEKYLQFYQNTYGLETVALRYSNVYGPRQNPHGEAGVVAIFIQKMLSGEVPCINGDGLQTRDYIYVADVVKANILALKAGTQGVFNIATGQETNVLEIYGALQKILNFSPSPKHGEAKPGEQRRSALSFEKIHQMHHWSPETTFPQGLQNTVKYFQSK